MPQAENVKVIVRCRPFNDKERSENGYNIVEASNELAQVVVQPVKMQNDRQAQKAPRKFTFDGVYGPESQNQEIFDKSFLPLVQSVIEGYNACIFAYGQTGSGKTFTMTGTPSSPGAIINSFQYIFESIEKLSTCEFRVTASFVEVYIEQIRDLLVPDTGKRLQVREHAQRGVYIDGVSQFAVQSERDLMELMEKGSEQRKTAATKMNETSSRSHSIFLIRVERAEEIDGKQTFRTGKLNLVDLAGSERQRDTGAEGQRLDEANAINKSLTHLGNVIKQLVDQKPHISYRDSVLTRLLQESLGGNSKTLMCANINSSSTNYDQTISTLVYADRAKQIKNCAVINEDPKDAQIRIMRDRIEELQRLIAQIQSGGPRETKRMRQLIKAINKQRNGQFVYDDEIEEELEEEAGEAEAFDVTADPQYQRLQAELAEKNQAKEAAKSELLELAKQREFLQAEITIRNDLQHKALQRRREVHEAQRKIAAQQERENVLKRELLRRAEEAEKLKMQQDAQRDVQLARRLEVERLAQEIERIAEEFAEQKEMHQDLLADITAERAHLQAQSQLYEQIAERYVPQFQFKRINAALQYDEKTDVFSNVFLRKNLAQFQNDALSIQIIYPRGNVLPTHVHEDAAAEDDFASCRMNLEEMGIDEPERMTIPEGELNDDEEMYAEGMWRE